MFNMGFSEIIFLFAIALIVIGPKQLPEMARVLARLINEFRDATGDIFKTVSDTKAKAQKIYDDTQDAVLQEVDKAKDRVEKNLNLDDIKQSLKKTDSDDQES